MHKRKVVHGLDHHDKRKLREQIELRLETWLKEDNTNDQFTVTSKSDTTIIHIGQQDPLNLLLYLYLQSNDSQSLYDDADIHLEIEVLHEKINQWQRKNNEFMQEIQGPYHQDEYFTGGSYAKKALRG